jgi:hypothetical protein
MVETGTRGEGGGCADSSGEGRPGGGGGDGAEHGWSTRKHGLVWSNGVKMRNARPTAARRQVAMNESQIQKRTEREHFSPLDLAPFTSRVKHSACRPRSTSVCILPLLLRSLPCLPSFQLRQRPPSPLVSSRYLAGIRLRHSQRLQCARRTGGC